MELRRQLQVNSPKYQNNGIKILVIGDDGVGKSTLIKELCAITNYCLRNKQNYEQLRALPELQYIEASLVDMPNLRPITINICDVFILTYAVDDIESFNYVKTVATDIKQIKGEDVPMLVVANKDDIVDHQVDHIMADRVVTVLIDVEHMSTCANTGVGIRDLFSMLLSFFGQEAVNFDDDVERSPFTFCRFLRKKILSVRKTNI